MFIIRYNRSVVPSQPFLVHATLKHHKFSRYTRALDNNNNFGNHARELVIAFAILLLKYIYILNKFNKTKLIIFNKKNKNVN